ncbi:hypothetical protein EDD17DRAFT_1606799 [Pisolithus thermaeus]|nr:hypothetical protein EDD17DRAFT_1606799 [Pisolithus thermaeus]
MPLKPLHVVLLKSQRSCLPSSTWASHCEKNMSVASQSRPCAYFSCSWNFLGQVDSMPHLDFQSAISCLTFSSGGVSECTKGCRYKLGSMSQDTPPALVSVGLWVVASLPMVHFLALFLVAWSLTFSLCMSCTPRFDSQCSAAAHCLSFFIATRVAPIYKHQNSSCKEVQLVDCRIVNAAYLV